MLRLRVYLDTFPLAPGPFAKALWWRVLGKRVRSRGQFAPLLAGSRHAYDLWMGRASMPVGSDTGPQIVAVVARGPRHDETCDSLARQAVPVIADAAEAPDDGWLYLTR